MTEIRRLEPRPLHGGPSVPISSHCSFSPKSQPVGPEAVSLESLLEAPACLCSDILSWISDPESVSRPRWSKPVLRQGVRVSYSGMAH